MRRLMMKSLAKLLLTLVVFILAVIGLAVVLSILFPLSASSAPLAELTTTGAVVNPLEELRYCGKPVRNARGQIIRHQQPLVAFRSWHACPSTGKHTGACPGWAIDHVVPLACGGCDAVFNMQWLPNDAKSASGPHHKDRFERKVYGASPPIADTSECTFVTPGRTIP